MPADARMPESARILNWDGCRNARDLGDLPLRSGGVTRLGSLVRSDTPSRLTPAGWDALYAYGIRAILTLATRGMREPELDVSPPFPEIAVTRVEIEDVTDPEFRARWASSELWCTPLYYADALRRWPERHAAAITTIARAPAGGVLFHCIRGHDRTGIIALLVLTLLGVTPEAIAADYALSPDPERDALLQREHSSVPQALARALEGLDVEEYLLRGGAAPADLAALRARAAAGRLLTAADAA